MDAESLLFIMQYNSMYNSITNNSNNLSNFTVSYYYQELCT